LAPAGSVIARSDSAAIVHAIVLVIFFSEGSIGRLHNTNGLGKFRRRDSSAGPQCILTLSIHNFAVNAASRTMLVMP
jgi:hypothetical protein